MLYCDGLHDKKICLTREDSQLPFSHSVKPTFAEGYSSTVYGHQGDTVTLTCVVSAYPDPEVTWYKLGTMVLQNNDTFKISCKYSGSSKVCTLQVSTGIDNHLYYVFIVDGKFNQKIKLHILRSLIKNWIKVTY